LGANCLKSEKKNTEKFDERMLRMLEKKGGPDEEQTEKDMLAWIRDKKKTFRDLMGTLGMPLDVFDEKEDLGKHHTHSLTHTLHTGLETYISIYAARGEDFNQKLIKDAMGELGIGAGATLKLFRNLDQWRIVALANKEADTKAHLAEWRATHNPELQGPILPSQVRKERHPDPP
jgi:hypothetical protein